MITISPMFVRELIAFAPHCVSLPPTLLCRICDGPLQGQATRNLGGSHLGVASKGTLICIKETLVVELLKLHVYLGILVISD